MECPTCGGVNPLEARFCEVCGVQLSGGGEEAVAVATREGPLTSGAVVAGRYRVKALVESGAINVYEAVDGEEDTPCLLVEEVDPQQVLERQYQLLSELEEPGLWKPVDFLERGGRAYLVGPLPGSRTLEARLEEGPLAPGEVVELAASVARSLAALHRAGWLHKAVSPRAIRLGEEGQAVLVGFEWAAPLDAPCEEYTVVEGFSSPEAYGVQGGKLDARSDLFSLGAVMYFCLTGERRDLESRESFFTFPRPPIRGADPLVELVLRTVSREPDRRPRDAEAFLEELEKVRQAMEAGPAPPQERIRPLCGEYQVATRTHVGCVRSVNQDACLELRLTAWERDARTPAHLVVVADGMGGEAEGDKAASLAIRALAQEVVERFLPLPPRRGETSLLLPAEAEERNRVILRRGFERANRVIREYASRESTRRGMGCTLTAALLEGDLAVLAHVGDTRAYRVAGEVDQVTTDHSLVGRLVEMGRLTREEARSSPQRSVIYRALGTSEEVEVDLYHRRLGPGDYLVICSDGVWEYFPDEELLEVVRGEEEPARICRTLVERCLERGADDNATVAVVRAPTEDLWGQAGKDPTNPGSEEE